MKSKRAITGIVALALGALALAFFIDPHPAHAAIVDVPKNPNDVGKDDVINVITNLIQYALVFASAIAAIFVAINGYQYIFSAGNPDKVEKAKMGLTWSIGGFILAISAYAIVYLTARTLGFKQLGNLESHKPGSVPSAPSNIITDLAGILFMFAGAVAVFFIILGGYRYVTSQGNQDNAEKAKKTLIYAVVGLIIVFISVLIFNAISTNLEVK